MNQYQVKIPEHNAYLVRYKAVSQNQFIIDVNVDAEAAGQFDEDDYILELCRKSFPQVIITDCGMICDPGRLSPQKEKPPEGDWL